MNTNIELKREIDAVKNRNGYLWCDNLRPRPTGGVTHIRLISYAPVAGVIKYIFKYFVYVRMVPGSKFEPKKKMLVNYYKQDSSPMLISPKKNWNDKMHEEVRDERDKMRTSLTVYTHTHLGAGDGVGDSESNIRTRFTILFISCMSSPFRSVRSFAFDRILYGKLVCSEHN